MIRFLLNLYVLILILDTILSYIPQARSHELGILIRKAADFTCRPIRRLLPPDLPFDFSPLIVILIIGFIKAAW